MMFRLAVCLAFCLLLLASALEHARIIRTEGSEDFYLQVQNTIRKIQDERSVQVLLNAIRLKDAQDGTVSVARAEIVQSLDPYVLVNEPVPNLGAALDPNSKEKLSALVKTTMLLANPTFWEDTWRVPKQGVLQLMHRNFNPAVIQWNANRFLFAVNGMFRWFDSSQKLVSRPVFGIHPNSYNLVEKLPAVQHSVTDMRILKSSDGKTLIALYSGCLNFDCVGARSNDSARAGNYMFLSTAKLDASVKDFRMSHSTLLRYTEKEAVYRSWKGHAVHMQKNWIPFEYNQEIFFIQRLHPMHILKVVETDNNGIASLKTVHVANENYQLPWRKEYGLPLKGGTPAISLNGKLYLTVFHTTTVIAGFRVYFMGAATFCAQPPFRLMSMSEFPILQPQYYLGQPLASRFSDTKDISYSLFPLGLSLSSDGEHVWLSFGHQNSVGLVAKLRLITLLQSMKKIGSCGPIGGAGSIGGVDIPFRKYQSRVITNTMTGLSYVRQPNDVLRLLPDNYTRGIIIDKLKFLTSTMLKKQEFEEDVQSLDRFAVSQGMMPSLLPNPAVERAKERIRIFVQTAEIIEYPWFLKETRLIPLALKFDETHGNFNPSVVRWDENRFLFCSNGVFRWYDKNFNARKDPFLGLTATTGVALKRLPNIPHGINDIRLLPFENRTGFIVTYGGCVNFDCMGTKNSTLAGQYIFQTGANINPKTGDLVFSESTMLPYAGDDVFSKWEPKHSVHTQKNWFPFIYDDRVYLVRRLQPMTISTLVRRDNKEGIGEIKTLHTNQELRVMPWRHEYGMPLKGSTPAILVRGVYLTIFHTTAMIHRKRVYLIGALTFCAHPPFNILSMSEFPIVNSTFYRGPWLSAVFYKKQPISYCLFPIGLSLSADGKELYVSFGYQNKDGYMMTLETEGLLQSLVKCGECGKAVIA